jgi:4-hydroxy-3-methylbut-2-enyl diphosphate reductase IspH
MQPNGVPMQYQSPRKVQLKHNCDAFSLMGSLASVNTTGLSHLSARNTNRIWNVNKDNVAEFFRSSPDST